MIEKPVAHAALTPESLQPILDGWRAAEPGMAVFALLPEAERQSLDVLQKSCRERDINLLGGIFPAFIIDRDFVRDGVLLLRLDRMPPSFLLPGLEPSGADSAGKLSEAVTELLDRQVDRTGKPLLFLLFDAMLPNINSLLDQLYLQAGDRVRYAGANAGSETFTPMPCLFDSCQIIAGGVLGMLLPENAQFCVEHGYTAPEHVMMASASESNRIIAIDWRPAFDIYQEIMHRDYGIGLTRANFYQYAVHYPFGILRANGEVVVRIPVALTEDGSIYCIGEVPENNLLALLRAPELNDSQCLDQLGEHLGNSAAGVALLTFYCAGRRMHLGEAANRELAELASRTGSRVAGALSLGEIGGSDSDYPLFHNAALVCAPWPPR